MDRRVFVKNTVILTGASLFLRGVGMLFRVYLAAQIGAGGMGLYQLIATVYSLAVTVATSGMSIAATRMVTEELAKSSGSLKSLCRKLLLVSLVMGTAAAALLYLGAGWAGEHWLHDQRAVLPLKILSASLPPVAVGSCLQGYFMARRRVSVTSGVQMAEQVIRIGLVVALLPRALERGTEFACAAVVLGSTVAEVVSASLLVLRYRWDLGQVLKKTRGPKKPLPVLGRLWGIAAPVAATRYVGSSLAALENILVPGCLAVFVGSREVALEQFGALKGMAMAVLFFPFSFLAALSTLLLPEITEAHALGRRAALEQLVSRTVGITLWVSVFTSGLLTVFARPLGELLYHDSQVGFYIGVLGPVMPFLYLESMVDGILKGLNQQLSTFRYSVWDSLLRILLVVVLVPRSGMKGFLFVMLVSNLFTALLNFRRLLTVTGLPMRWGRWVLQPLGALGAATAACRLLPGADVIAWPGVLLGALVLGLVYLLCLFLTGAPAELFGRKRVPESSH